MRMMDLASRVSLKDAMRGLLPALRRVPSLSFSFYGEDVLLSHLHPQARGFYVDVGAFDPRMHSNTYKLYLKGWRGITVEPNPDIAPDFRTARPRDEHLTIGIAREAAELTYFRFRDPAQNTFDADRAAELTADKVNEVPVPCLPLEEVLELHCADQQVDLLNVDCEARDFDVLQSLDWRRHRPTVLIVEDFEQFESGGQQAPRLSPIRAFMLGQDYALAAQTFFSSFYLDRHAFHRANAGIGFRLDQSQLGMLALDS